MDEFFRILNCKTTKEIWDTLETTHEGTEEANVTLMASHHYDNEENEVNDYEINDIPS